MTEVEYYYRLQEVVLNSGVDDAADLAAFCNKKMTQAERARQPQLLKAKIKKEQQDIYKENIMTILENDVYAFKKMDEILSSLRIRYGFKSWEKNEVLAIISILVRENKVEKMYFQDLNTHKGEVRYRKKI